MKKIMLLSSIGILFLCNSLTAQKINTDSLALIAKISTDQLKLGKLENMVNQKTINKNDAATTAQNSANTNANAAQNLTADPTNKNLANDAGNKANDAKSDSKKSRKESAKLDELNKNIMDLRGKIANEQAKLITYTQPGGTVPASLNVPIQTDSTHHL
jgi:hypothetical protein